MEHLKVCQEPSLETEKLDKFLRSWGLRRYADEAAYFRWQQESLTGEELLQLNRSAQERRDGHDPHADIRFYDLAAQPRILPVLYSQRYDYYFVVGSAIAKRIEPARHVLDFGCGVGILTTFFATLYPHVDFLGIDRSGISIRVAQEQAEQRGLTNVRFEQCQIPDDPIPGTFDLIISSHAMFQAESDPGLPSRSWRTFERENDSADQIQAEAATGLKHRLDHLSSALTPQGRMLLCEKAQHLGRRVLLQRAMHARGYRSVADPIFFRYRAIDEIMEDGPLYEIVREAPDGMHPWEENPFFQKGDSVFTCQGSAASDLMACMTDSQASHSVSIQSKQFGTSLLTFGKWNDCLAYGFVRTPSGFCGAILESLAVEQTISSFFSGMEGWTGEDFEQFIGQLWPHRELGADDTTSPCYENHTSCAQIIWASLPTRQVKEETTLREKDGREKHIEFGICDPFAYLYWANTYDQRQLVLTAMHRLPMLEDYYRESLQDSHPPDASNP